MRPTVIVIFDSVKDEISIVRRCGRTPKTRRRQGLQGGAEASQGRGRGARCSRCRMARALSLEEARAAGAALQHDARANIMGMVEQAKEYIRAGDIFQVVLSQRFSAPFALPPFALYRALRRHESVAVPVPSRSRLVRAGRLVAGNPRARARRRGDHPADRGHGAARGDRRRGQGAGGCAAAPIRRSAPST